MVGEALYFFERDALFDERIGYGLMWKSPVRRFVGCFLL
jgi:hypothetical protein